MKKHDLRVQLKVDDEGIVTEIGTTSADFENEVPVAYLKEHSPVGMRMPSELKKWGEGLVNEFGPASLTISRPKHHIMVIQSDDNAPGVRP